MKRDFPPCLYAENAQEGYAPGDEYAHRAAAALADRADAPTIGVFMDILTLLEKVGGQVYLTGLRIEREDSSFTFEGFGVRYDTADARMRGTVKPPTEVAGVPVIDMSATAPEVDLSVEDPEPPPLPPEPEEDLRDQIEAELDEAPDPEPVSA